METKIPVGILGATGIVGQRFMQMLEHHPWFEVAWLAASDRSEGRAYGDAARWRLKTSIPDRGQNDRLPCGARRRSQSHLRRARCQHRCRSRASFRRRRLRCGLQFQCPAHATDVPLVIPEVNACHIKLIESQAGGEVGGFVVTNPNCSAIGLVLALAPLHQRLAWTR